MTFADLANLARRSAADISLEKMGWRIMNSHQTFVTEQCEILRSSRTVPDAERFPKAPVDAMPGWHRRKRQEAMQVLVRCCELWEDADRIGLMAVRDKLEPAIMHAHDAFVQVREPARQMSVSPRS